MTSFFDSHCTYLLTFFMLRLHRIQFLFALAKKGVKWVTTLEGVQVCRLKQTSLKSLMKIGLWIFSHPSHLSLCSEATVILVPITKWDVSKRGILKSLVFHVLNHKSWIKLIYDTVSVCNFVINQFNPTFEVQNMANEAFQNASFGNASFPNEALGYSCLWA